MYFRRGTTGRKLCSLWKFWKAQNLFWQTILKVYERVKYGDNSKKEIIMTPDKGYEIIAITVNGEKHVFTQNEDGTYTMPVIQNITEDQYIEVSYGIKYEDIIDDKNNNIIVINKIDSKTKEPIPEVTFKIEEVKKREGL